MTSQSAAAVLTDTDPSHRHRWWTLAVLCLSLVLVSVDNTILNVALPTVGRELDASGGDLQWIVDGYTLVFAGLLLTAGSLGDRFGRRGALTTGMAIFGVGSIAAAFAGDATQLIACRALMGVGAACIMPATLSILTNVFRDPAERAKAIALWAGCAGLGVALGPVSGGWLIDHFWWGSVFLVNIPVLAVALVGARLVVPTSRDPEAPRIDVVGSLLSVVGLTALLWAIIEAGEQSWTSTAPVAAFALAVVVLGVFLVWESRQAEPMLDIHLFRSARFSAASGAITLTFFSLMGSMFLLTQYMQSVLDYSALQSGVRYLPLAGVMLVVAPQSARLAAWLGAKVVVTSGLVLIATGLFLLLRVDVDSGYGPVLVSMLFLAAGMGLTMAPATDSIMGALPPDKAGIGSAVNDTTRELGGALGVAVLGSVLASSYGSQMHDVIGAGDLPDESAAVAQEHVGGALHVASAVGGDTGRALADAARSAFVDGLHTTSVIAAVIAVVGALVALRFLPAHAPDLAVGTVDPVDDGAADDPAVLLDQAELVPV